MERLLTVSEVAEMLRVKPSWVHEYSRPGNPILPSIKVGKKCKRFKESDVLQFLQQNPKSETETKNP